LTESRSSRPAGAGDRSEITPMLCGSAFKNKGVQAMLEPVVEFLPSPSIFRRSPEPTITNGRCERIADEREKFAALAFKIMTDPYVGQLIFFRVYWG